MSTRATRSEPTQPTARHCLLCALGISALVMSGPGRAAHGHSLQYPRLVQLRLVPGLIEVGVQNAVHSGSRARSLREEADTDADGRLSAEEQDVVARRLDQEARAALRLSLDGVLLDPELGQLDLDLSNDETVDAGEGVAMRSTAAVAIVLLPGVHDIELHGVPVDPRVLLPTRIDLPTDWTVEALPATGEAVPARRLSEGAWLSGFLGAGGSARLRVVVPARRPPGEAASP